MHRVVDVRDIATSEDRPPRFGWRECSQRGNTGRGRAERDPAPQKLDRHRIRAVGWGWNSL